jgi:hypothetical protein
MSLKFNDLVVNQLNLKAAETLYCCRLHFAECSNDGTIYVAWTSIRAFYGSKRQVAKIHAIRKVLEAKHVLFFIFCRWRCGLYFAIGVKEPSRSVQRTMLHSGSRYVNASPKWQLQIFAPARQCHSVTGAEGIFHFPHHKQGEQNKRTALAKR